MLRLVSLAPLASYAVNIILAAPPGLAAPASPSICDGYVWGVTIQPLADGSMTIYNQYVQTTSCAGPAWVQSSTLPTPPLSISPWGTKYDCNVPAIQYHCGETLVVTCCGNSTASA